MADRMNDISTLAKRRGFIYQGSALYGGLAGTWDYGPLGIALKRNIINTWWNRFVEQRDDMYGVDAALLMNQKVWQASGHVAGFADPLTEDLKTNKRYRADHLLEEAGVDPRGMSIQQMNDIVVEKKLKSPDGNGLGPVRQFNMMFKTHIGATEDEASVLYLRPETAQGMFVNFKNVLDSFHPKMPFGLAQIGKAFRNEIAPRDFIFRVRELEQMEIEYFVRAEEWQQHFEYWLTQMREWIASLGLPPQSVSEYEVPEADRAHYSKRTVDFEFEFPFGRKELYGLAYRTDFDLKNHAEASGQELSYFDEALGERFVPHVIEPTFGVERTVLAVLTNAYSEDELGGEKRVFLKFPTHLAPVQVAVLPLLKNKPELVAKAKAVRDTIKQQFRTQYDDAGTIGKRYRRQDEIGTPFCVTIDFDTLENDTVTIRHRDTGEQTRVAIAALAKTLS